ncbi:MAG TPA: hypothetical protein VKT52_02130, partial [Ktedonobacterales bacterium]|nr:hypothetical protein [Ktedonobacterales bacterium]
MAEEHSGMAGETPLTLAEAVRQRRAGETTSVELVEACLRRIEQWEPVIQACVTVLGDAALERARATDEA